MSTIRPLGFHDVRKPACRSNGSTRSMKNGSSSLTLTKSRGERECLEVKRAHIRLAAETFSIVRSAG